MTLLRFAYAGLGTVGLAVAGMVTLHGLALLAVLLVAWGIAAVVGGLAVGAAIHKMDSG